MERYGGRKRGAMALAITTGIFALGACQDDPMGPAAAIADDAPAPALSVVIEAVPGLLAAELTESEVRRVADVLAAVPEADRLAHALTSFATALEQGQGFEAAQAVLRRIEEVSASDTGAAMAPDLDGLRLLLDAFSFEEPGTSGASTPARLTIW